MKIIAIGYGRVGSQFIRKVDTEAHQVVVIDKERSALERAEPPQGVRFVYGNATDEDLLRDAGAESADLLLALTRDENTNLMIAQIARVIFNIPRVIAIVYDADRESYFHEAGIETLAQCHNLSINDFDGIEAFIRKNDIGFTVIGPEQPLVNGLVHAFLNGFYFSKTVQDAGRIPCNFTCRPEINTAEHDDQKHGNNPHVNLSGPDKPCS